MVSAIGRHIGRTLKSPKLIVLLAICMVVILILGHAVPQRKIEFHEYVDWKISRPGVASFADTLGLSEIYTSPLAVAIIAAFFLSLAVLFVSRVPAVLNLCRKAEPSGVDPQTSSCTEVAVGDADTSKIFQIVRKRFKGYSMETDGGTFVADRFRYGPLGSVFIFASIFILFVGGMSVFYTRTSGDVVLTEGQLFQGNASDYRWFRPPLVGSPPRLGFIVAAISPPAGGWDSSGLRASIYVTTDKGNEAINLESGKSVKAGNARVRITEAGVSPLIVFGGPDRIIENAYISLRVLYGKEDYYPFADTAYRARFKFYPDYYKGNFGDATRSLQMKNPVFRVGIYKEDELVKDELVRPGDEIRFDGLTLGILDMRLWGSFVVTKKWGTDILVAGLIIGGIGIVWRLFLFRRQIRGELRGDNLCLAGWSERFPALNERRVRSLVEELGGESGL